MRALSRPRKVLYTTCRVADWLSIYFSAVMDTGGLMDGLVTKFLPVLFREL
jgi:hypothetical protein